MSWGILPACIPMYRMHADLMKARGGQWILWY